MYVCVCGVYVCVCVQVGGSCVERDVDILRVCVYACVFVLCVLVYVYVYVCMFV